MRQERGHDGTLRVTRRTLLAGALSTAALAASGCGLVSGERPRILPPPAPDPAGHAVVDERARTAHVLSVATAVDDPLAAVLAPLHAAALAALDAALRSLDPPVDPGPTPGDDASGGTPGTPPGGVLPSPGADPETGTDALAALTRADLTAAASDGLDTASLAALDELHPQTAPVVLASHVQRAVALGLLEDRVVEMDVPWRAASGELALSLVEDVRAAAYALEVAAAQTPQPDREAVIDVLSRLRFAESGFARQVDTEHSPPRPLGYALPGPVTTPEQAAALTDGVLRRLLGGVIAAFAPTAQTLQEAEDPDPAGTMPTLLALATAVETGRIRCGGEPVAVTERI